MLESMTAPRRACLLIAALTSVALCVSCGTEEADTTLPGQCKSPIAVATPSNSKLKVGNDGALIDADGRRITMRGLNSGGRSKWAPFVPFPIAADEPLQSFLSKADSYFARYKPWGLDTVRLTFSWEALEPTKGKYDEAYLDRYEAMVQAAGKHGLKVIVDFHQDVYASPFCGDGFPLWTLKKADPGPPCRNNAAWFTKYFDAEVQNSFKRLYENTDGVLDAFKAMWVKMATRIVKQPNVVGFEIINEPGGWRSDNIKTWKDGVLNPFHSDMVATLRKAVGPDKLILFDNPGVEALAANTHHVKPKGEGLMYAPHYYDSGLLLGQKTSGAKPANDLASHATYATQNGLHVLLGEFGYGHAATGGEGWLNAVMDVIDTERWSATLWEYSRNEELWNLEDLSVVEPDGKERKILDVYVRPWLRAVAGLAETFKYDPATGKATAEWKANGGVSELVVPARSFPEGPRDISLTGGCWTWDEARSELRVRGDEGATVKLSFGK